MKIALAGIGGFGSQFVSGILDAKERTDISLVAAVDPFPKSCPRYEALVALGVPIYSSLEEMFASHRPDLVVLSSPIQFHCEQTVLALGHGSHVLCEKPLGASLEQIQQMTEARDRAGRQVAIGYQWSFSPAIQSLKSDIRQGLLGKPRRLSTIICWPRTNHYYNRNRWAGRQFDDQNRPVFDSPVNNACAHYVHNMFYVLGNASDRSAMPRDVKAELYRANPIENYDTAAISCRTDGDAEIYIFMSHAIARQRGPLFRYEFENAVVSMEEGSGEEIVARSDDGHLKSHGYPTAGIEKLWITIDAIRSGSPTCCGIEAASAQTHLMLEAQKSEIVNFAPARVHSHDTKDGRLLVVDGLEECLFRCYEEHKLPKGI